jgi:hypothetical protein
MSVFDSQHRHDSGVTDKKKKKKKESQGKKKVPSNVRRILR